MYTFVLHHLIQTGTIFSASVAITKTYKTTNTRTWKKAPYNDPCIPTFSTISFRTKAIFSASIAIAKIYKISKTRGGKKSCLRNFILTIPLPIWRKVPYYEPCVLSFSTITFRSAATFSPSIVITEIYKITKTRACKKPVFYILSGPYHLQL